MTDSGAPDRACHVSDGVDSVLSACASASAREEWRPLLDRIPNEIEALLLAGSRALERSMDEVALAIADRALAISPDDARAHMMRGDALAELKRRDDALAAYSQATAITPTSANAFNKRGKILLKLGRHAEALASFTRGVALDGARVDGWSGLGRAFSKFQRYPLAIGAYRRALELAPDRPFLKGRLLQQMALSCDWDNLGPLVESIEQDLAGGRQSARPFIWHALSNSPQSLLDCARIYNAEHIRTARSRPVEPRVRAPGRIRLGYISGEFCEHPTSILMAGVYEAHDKAQFELFAFDNGWDDGGPTRARINRAMDHIVSIRGLSDGEATASIAGTQIDILVDLNGFWGRHRAAVCAQRPAPVQLLLGGYPGSIGGGYLDYIVADSIVIPHDQRQFYTEQVIEMPHSYQANDRMRAIAERTSSRSEQGLPESGFVFCCFNNNYKIMPAVFDCWVRILQAVPDSVLWLLADNAAAVANLRNAAECRGLDPDRLIFADRAPLAEHLARHRLADLFLDTLPCNAHATASDALWAGLPVLTCLGTTFSGRVAASVLHAIGLPELVTTSLDQYVERAIHFGQHADALSRIRETLTRNRLTTPLFDSVIYTRHLEAAYRQVHERHCAGLPPAPIAVQRQFVPDAHV